MRTPLRHGPEIALLAGLWLAFGFLDLRAQTTPPAPPADSSLSGSAAIAAAREWFKQGDYDRAIEALRTSLDRGGHPVPIQHDLYLQLIKGYVLLGNDLKSRWQGRESSELNYNTARQRMAECLSKPALRHVRPDPESDYPPEMVRDFAAVRARMLGTFRVVSVTPRRAAVVLDADTLQAGADNTYVAEDVLAGPHLLTIAAEGHRPLTETVDISPGATLERSYVLTERKSALWYVTRGAVLAGAAVGVGILVGSGESASSESDLPAAPLPPSK